MGEFGCGVFADLDREWAEVGFDLLYGAGSGLDQEPRVKKSDK